MAAWTRRIWSLLIAAAWLSLILGPVVAQHTWHGWDFESGILEGWNAAGRMPVTLVKAEAQQGVQGRFLIDTRTAGRAAGEDKSEESTLLSPPFTCRQPYIFFLLGGRGRHTLELIDAKSGELLRQACVTGDMVLRRRSWHVADLGDRVCRLCIRGREADGGLLLDDVHPGLASQWPNNEKLWAQLDQERNAWLDRVRKNLEATGPVWRTVGSMPLGGVGAPGCTIDHQGRVAAGSFKSPAAEVYIVLDDHRAGRLTGERMRTEFPLAFIALSTGGLPIQATLEALTPFIPLDERRSGYPAAFLYYHLTNACTNTAHGCLEFRLDPRAFGFPEQTAPVAFTNKLGHGLYLRDKERSVALLAMSNTAYHVGASLRMPFVLEGATNRTLPLALTWHARQVRGMPLAMGDWFNDALAVMEACLREHETLISLTRRYHAALFASTMPDYVLDRIAHSPAILASETCARAPANRLHLSAHAHAPFLPPRPAQSYECCSATLFPALARTAREAEFQAQNRDGALFAQPEQNNDVFLMDYHLCAILKVYREHLRCTDNDFLKSLWPRVSRALDYALIQDSRDTAGEDALKAADGLLEQAYACYHGNPMKGPNTYLNTLYLACLLAGERMATAMNDDAKAQTCREVFEKGTVQLTQKTYSKTSRFFVQNGSHASCAVSAGPGCFSDQLYGAWWAHQLGLERVVPADMAAGACRAILERNFIVDPVRAPAWTAVPVGAAQSGLRLVTWREQPVPANPLNRAAWFIPAVEYEMAVNCACEGYVNQAFVLTRSCFERSLRQPVTGPPWYDGPWSALDMGAWSLLPALSGYTFDGPRQCLRFAPRYRPNDFAVFICGAEGWGFLRQQRGDGMQTAELTVHCGRFTLRSFELGLPEEKRGIAPQQTMALVNEKETPVSTELVQQHLVCSFEQPLVLQTGSVLRVEMQWP